MERLKKVCFCLKPNFENLSLKLAPEFKLFQRNQLKFSILFTVLIFLVTFFIKEKSDKRMIKSIIKNKQTLQLISGFK